MSDPQNDPARHDGLLNCVTGLGDPELDTRQNTRRTRTPWRSVYEYEQEYRQNWMAGREVDQLAYDMHREGFDIVGLPDDVDVGKIMSLVEGEQRIRPDGQLLDDPGLLHHMFRCRRDGAKVGGAAILAIVDDGLDPIEPIDVRRIRRIVGWEVLDRSEITPWSYLSGANVTPEYYIITDVLAIDGAGHRGHGKDGTIQPGQVIHRSRLRFYKGRELSRREERNHLWWGDSDLEKTFNERRAAEEGMAYADTYMDRVSWLRLAIANLAEALRAKDENGNPIGEEIIRNRIRSFRETTRTLGVAVIDGGRQATESRDGKKTGGRPADQLESVNESAGDLPDLIKLNWDAWQMGTGLPKSIAFGEAPSGLRGGDNAGDWQAWQGVVRSHQRDWGTPIVTWMLSLVFAAKDGPTGGIIPDKWTINWRPLIVPTPAEEAEIAELQAKADNLRIASQTVTANEVRQQRMVHGDTSGPLRVEPDDPDEDDVETGLAPAQVGIATAVLEGGQAVAQGTVTPEFFGWYLTGIDEQRYPPDRAAEGARLAVPKSPPVDETQDEDDPILLPEKMPTDLRTKKVLLSEIEKRTGMELTSRGLTDRLAQAGVRKWPVGNREGYSLRESLAALTGMTSEAAPPEDDAATDGD